MNSNFERQRKMQEREERKLSMHQGQGTPTLQSRNYFGVQKPASAEMRFEKHNYDTLRSARGRASGRNPASFGVIQYEDFDDQTPDADSDLGVQDYRIKLNEPLTARDNGNVGRAQVNQQHDI